MNKYLVTFETGSSDDTVINVIAETAEGKTEDELYETFNALATITGRGDYSVQNFTLLDEVPTYTI